MDENRIERDNLYIQDPVTGPRSHTFHLQSLANQTQEAARRASDMLKQMECLKTDIKMLLTQKDAPEFTLPAPDCLQIQQNQPESQQSQSKPKQDQVQFHEEQLLLSNSDQSPNNLQQTDSQNTNPQFQSFHVQREESHKNMGRHLQSQHNQPHSQNHSQRPIQTPSQTGPLLIPDILCQEVHSQSSQRHQVYSHQSLSSLFQKKPDGPSMLEEAGQVLRQARRRKKVLEDNLEALLKSKTGEILHCQLEALAANREVTEGVRIKKTVDAWISALTRDVRDHPRPLHDEMPPVDAIQCRAANATKSQARASGRGKPMTLPKGISNKPGMGRGSRGQIAGHRAQTEPVGVSGNLMGSQQDDVDGELYLTRLYGKLPYEGLRRTLKKSPYPRFSSPASPLGRKPCPRLVESIRGVKLKSCKTQTSLTPFLNLSAGQPSKRDVFDSSHLDLHESDQFTVTCAESSTGATAIPLRLPRMDCPSRREHAQERPSALPAPLSVSEGNMIDRVDNQQKQQLVTEKPPSSSSCIIKIIAAESPREKEDEENIFPGNNFLSVTDVHQEDKSDVGEEAVMLEGGPSPAPVQYHSPAFPPEAPSSRCVETVKPVVTRSQPQDILENRLVEWVEQQLMSRIIADMYRPLTSDPAQNDSTDQSELEERSLSSDDVEAVGSGGLQLFVDSSVSVDSALIRQLVNEVLTETVAQILCQTNALNTAPEPGLDEPKSELTEDEEENLAPLVPTPVPTPLASVPQLSRETTPAATPPPSKPSSPVTRECPQPITAPEPVATPTATPEPHLPEESPSAAHQTPPPPICGNPELPLDEERSVEQLESQKQHLVVSVEEEELPVCRPVPAPAQSQPSLTDPSPALSPRLSETCSSSSSSKSSSSSTVTAETEAALKHISEGELLISINQLAPLTEEEGVCSFSSSLHEVEDMVSNQC
ncbi:hypothetical protein CHARACLAT_008328 [Characodon lateralis]|uniref:Protein TALPID3 n=1 Tax=Characodon lateralis TaxID=208331 RepID=A0ABU7EUU0_9TELE|nr:hypothetical protein [Characodon lateralis]